MSVPIKITVYSNTKKVCLNGKCRLSGGLKFKNI